MPKRHVFLLSILAAIYIQDAFAEELRLVQPPGANLTASGLESSLDPADCDPFNNVKIESTGECIKLRRRRPMPEIMQASDSFEGICSFSNKRYRPVVAPLDINSPCYGIDGSTVLRGRVTIFSE